MRLTDQYGWRVPQNGDRVDFEKDYGGLFDAIDAQLFEQQGRTNTAFASAQAVEQMQNDLLLRLKALEDAFLTNITGNPFSVRFDTLDNLVVTGNWNLALQRVEC